MIQLNSKDPIRYSHTCPTCQFLGTHDFFDIYFCREHEKTNGGIIVMRYGSYWEDYQSLLVHHALLSEDTNSLVYQIARYLLKNSYVKIIINEG